MIAKYYSQLYWIWRNPAVSGTLWPQLPISVTQHDAAGCLSHIYKPTAPCLIKEVRFIPPAIKFPQCLLSTSYWDILHAGIVMCHVLWTARTAPSKFPYDILGIPPPGNSGWDVATKIVNNYLVKTIIVIVVQSDFTSNDLLFIPLDSISRQMVRIWQWIVIWFLRPATPEGYCYIKHLCYSSAASFTITNRQSDSPQITAGKETLLTEGSRITKVISWPPAFMKNFLLVFCEYCKLLHRFLPTFTTVPPSPKNFCCSNFVKFPSFFFSFFFCS